MELITDKKTLNACFEKLLSSYKHINIAVAWATDKCSMYKLLCNHEEKISKMIVGLDFSHTTPQFIKKFMLNKKVRFLAMRNHTFHPKYYFFYNSPSDWSLIIGSANFTEGGFGANMEANTLITSNDCNNDFYEQSVNYINNIWKKSARLTSTGFNNYKTRFDKQKKEHPQVKFQFELTSNSAIIDNLTWEEYVQKVMKHSSSVKIRLRILERAHELFKQYRSFSDIPEEKRKCIAGIQRELSDMKGVDWGYFGTCSSNGKFKKAIIDNKSKLVKAIDEIPLFGEVTEKQYKKYCKIWRKEYKEPVALASRLLALKRPDLFVCINNRNRKALCNEFAISQSSLNLESYWVEIVSRIQSSIWYKDRSKSADNNNLKSYMAAMLDSIYYTPKE